MANQDMLMRLQQLLEGLVSELVKHTHYQTDTEIEHDDRIRAQNDWELMKWKTFAGLILLAIAGLLLILLAIAGLLGFVKGERAQAISAGVFGFAILLLIVPVRNVNLFAFMNCFA
jgi:hypothetical protein